MLTLNNPPDLGHDFSNSYYAFSRNSYVQSTVTEKFVLSNPHYHAVGG